MRVKRTDLLFHSFHWKLVIILTACFILSSEKIIAGSEEQKHYEQSDIDSSYYNDSTWKDISKNYRYEKTEEEKKEKKKEKKEDDVEQQKKEPENEWKFDWNATYVKTILVSIVFLVIISIVILLLRKSHWVFNQKIEDKNLLIKRLEENLPDNDIDPYILKAMQDKDYRLAFRLYYLLLIQKLIKKNHVKWRKEKTNGEYLVECVNRNYYNEFAHLTLAFDQVWYGEYPLSKEQFENYVSDFKNIFNQIEKG